jgi:uncharacterized cupredoxin-like copper-binding protein
MHRLRLAAAVAAVALLITACGGTDEPNSDGANADRTIEVDMVDIAFEPDTLEIEEGQTVRFVFSNAGEVAHDAFIGDSDAQQDHEDEMRKDDDGHDGGHGDEPEDAVTVEPGDTGELTYTFDEAGTLEIGCHQEGHYAAGMKTRIEAA